MADAHQQHTSRWMGIPMKHVSLVTLTLENSILILIMHYSRVMPLVNGHRYLTSTAVFLNEVVKLGISLTVALYDISRNLPPSTPATSLFSALYNNACTADSWKLAIPASLYTLQNSLQYIAVSNLDAATFQVTYQLKILTTALFSVALLGRSLSARKWIALILLTVGIAVVQIPSAESDTLAPLKDAQSRFFFPRSFEDMRGSWSGAGSSPHLTKRSATYEGIEEDLGLEHPQMSQSIGLAAVVAACVISGLAGVYFEKVLKDATSSVWVRNVQLSFYSLFPAFIIGVVVKDGEDIAAKGFFSGYNWAVWSVIGFQALGGVMVALCVNYADNIAKNFATSISIVISLLASVWFFDMEVSLNFLIGTTIVLFSTYLYSRHERPRPPPINIASYEKTTIGSVRGSGSRGGGESYFDDQPKNLTPIRASGNSTSRPSSPMRHHSRVASGRLKVAKRGD
ncbi:MAG: Sec63 [Chaenotheca gracillima]|nr:MAG: Sec63 [Chaenotheca gracillima]